MAERQWVRVRSQVGQKPSEPEKMPITGACERFLGEVLRPRFLPEIWPKGERPHSRIFRGGT